MSISIRATLAAVLVAALIPSPARAQGGRAPGQRLDSIAGAEVRANRSVGIVVAVVKGKEMLLLKAFGKADADSNVALSANTIVPIGSVAKQFTAAAILQLRDAGKLSLDDEITKWLPELEGRAKGATLRHVLGHTAGVPDVGDMRELREIQVFRNANVTRDSIYRIVIRYAFQFPAGSMQVYSNTGYWLLGRVVEKASGMTYEQYVAKKIFEPLGMSRSMYCDNSLKAGDRAYGYAMRNGMTRRSPDINFSGNFSAGAICSTAGDMVRWLQGLHSGKVLSPRSYTEMTTPSKLSDGTATRYGMGLTIWDDSRGLREIGHDGGGFGFSSQAWWHPDSQLAMVLLTNSEPDATNAIAEALAVEVLGPARTAGPFTGDASQLTGTYKGPGRGKEMAIAVTQAPQGPAFSVDGAAANPVQWVEALTFRRNPNGPLLTFRRDGSSGPASELHFDTGGDHFILKRQAVEATAQSTPQRPDSASRARQAAFVGFYENPARPGRGFDVLFTNDTLYLQQPGSPQKVRLVLDSGTIYHVDLPGARGTWEFTLGADGKTAQLVHVEPGLELIFVKVR